MVNFVCNFSPNGVFLLQIYTRFFFFSFSKKNAEYLIAIIHHVININSQCEIKYQGVKYKFIKSSF